LILAGDDIQSFLVQKQEDVKKKLCSGSSHLLSLLGKKVGMKYGKLIEEIGFFKKGMEKN
jgi:hypothetical protein